MKRSRREIVGLVMAALAMLAMTGIVRADLSSAATGHGGDRAPDGWTSGWVPIDPGQTLSFTHSLGGDPTLYGVDLWFRDTRSPGLGIHQRAYGGMDVAGTHHGAYWHNLTSEAVSVTRLADDVAVGQIRLRLWIPDAPDYTSAWLSPSPCGSAVPTHMLGGDLDDYAVGLLFEDTDPGGLGLHHYAFGGLEVDGADHGAYWHSLSDTVIYVQRGCEDTAVDRLRVTINRPDPPEYDSGWLDLAQGELRTLTHNLGGNPSTYVVRLSSQAAGVGRNTRALGGLEEDGLFYGANWERLTSSSINVVRRPDDITSSQVRVRIWAAEPEEPEGWQSWTNGNFVRSLALQDGFLWAGTEGGAVRWDAGSSTYRKYLAPEGLGDGDVRAVATEGSSLTWFGTYGGGLVAYDGATWTVFTSTDGLVYNWVYAIAFQDGIKWIGTNNGLSGFDDGTTPADKSDDTWTSFNKADGLSHGSVRALAVDASGRKWLGTSGGGLGVLDDGGTPHDKMDDLWGDFSEADGLASRNVYGVLVDEQSRVWSATTSGLSVLDHAGTP
ncbi:MAG TPA: hypothetical protein VM537_06045, partial [Anaerolineae bacterium]|nr:hypothetical protein [Anaerolineae bacterium]